MVWIGPGTPWRSVPISSPVRTWRRGKKKASEPKKAKPEKEQKPVAKVEMACPDCIEFEDFAKVDLRVGTVLEATPHPEADRLLVLKIDAGEDSPRQVVAGIAEFLWARGVGGQTGDQLKAP